MYGVFDTKADLLAMTEPARVDGNIAIVLKDETNDDRQVTYIYIEANSEWTKLSESSVSVRDFTTNPIDLSTEVTGVLSETNVDEAIARLDKVLDKDTYKGSTDGVVKSADTLEGLEFTIDEVNDTIDNSHSHSNKSILDKIGETENGDLTYNGSEIKGGDSIDDNATSADSTWSSEKIKTEIDNMSVGTGTDGKSAYEVWLELGNTGTEEDFINSLKGTNGDDGTDGADGKSAYEVWLELGNTGTEEDFINSLKGEDGVDGSNGSDGKSAYQSWLDLGNTGTEEDFINSLEGENGTDGKSAYEIWLELGNEGTEEDFINSLKGADGEIGSDSSDTNVTSIMQKTILNAVNGDTKYFSNDGNKIENVIVQPYKFVEGDTNVVEVIKSFDNTEEENFNCNSDNTDFNDTEGMKIEDTYTYSDLEEYTIDGLYITQTINLDEFKEIDTIKISR